jgi:dTDP-4-dehydrorhamnose 3,5-epimerase
MPFSFKRTPINGVVVVEPRIFADSRGFFMEAYKKSDFAKAGIAENFVQANHSQSTRGTLRGLHGQREPRAQGKLVRCIQGEIFDVAVDVRPGSLTFGKWFSVWLSSDNRYSLYVPPGCLHGFCVTSAEAQVIYHTTEEYAPELEYGVRWDDGTLQIPWPVQVPCLSERDAIWPTLAQSLSVVASNSLT